MVVFYCGIRIMDVRTALTIYIYNRFLKVFACFHFRDYELHKDMTYVGYHYGGIVMN